MLRLMLRLSRQKLPWLPAVGGRVPGAPASPPAAVDPSPPRRTPRRPASPGWRHGWPGAPGSRRKTSGQSCQFVSTSGNKNTFEPSK